MLTSPIRASKGLLTSWRELNRELFGRRQGCNGYGISGDGENKLEIRKRGIVNFDQAGWQERRERRRVRRRTEDKRGVSVDGENLK